MTKRNYSTLPKHAVFLLSLTAILLFFSWRKWPDPLIDFGRELYVPWQLSLGKTLYLDISYFNGPFPLILILYYSGFLGWECWFLFGLMSLY